MILDIKTRHELMQPYVRRYVLYEEEKGGLWLGDIVMHDGIIQQVQGITTGGPAYLYPSEKIVWFNDVIILNRVIRDETYEEYLQRTGEWRS